MAFFIAFEGLDGSGKSTLIKGLAAHLTQLGLAHVLTREPGGTALGEEIRQMLLRTDGEVPSPRTELLLYQAGRAQHVDLKIAPALGSGKWVLCDRFYASTTAFQAGARGIAEDRVAWLNEFAVFGTHPHLWVLVDVPVDVAARRLQSRVDSGSARDRFEEENASFHERVRAAYLAQAKGSTNWLVLDGHLEPHRLLEDLLAELRRRKWLPS